MTENDILQTKIEHIRNGLEYTYPKIGMAIKPVDWQNPTNAYRKMLASGQDLTIENQFQSSSCGGNIEYGATLTDFLLTGKVVRKSRRFPYHYCYVRGGGSSFQGLGNTWKNRGIPSEALCPSYKADGTADEEFYQKEPISLEAIADALNCRCESFAEVNRFSIEAVAQAIRDEGFALIGYHGFNNGTMLTFYPKHPNVDYSMCWQHWVVAVDYFIEKGRYWIKIANSWDKTIGDKGYQYFSSDYFASGSVWCAGVFTDKVKVNIPPPSAFHYTFTKPIQYKEKSKEVENLQRALVKLGFLTMPAGVAYGYYGQLTRQAVLKYQIEKNIASLAELTKLNGENVGPKTRAKLSSDLS
jgi:hypothetical protein